MKTFLSGVIALAAMVSPVSAQHALTQAQIEARDNCNGMTRCIARVTRDVRAAEEANACTYVFKNGKLAGVLSGSASVCKTAAARYKPAQQQMIEVACTPVLNKVQGANKDMCDRLLAGLTPVPTPKAPDHPPVMQAKR